MALHVPMKMLEPSANLLVCNGFFFNGISGIAVLSEKNQHYVIVSCLPLLLQERYRKALADSENVRRRTQKFVEDAKLFGEQSDTELCLLQ